MSDYAGFFRPTALLSTSGPLMLALEREGYTLHIARCWNERGPNGFDYDWYLFHSDKPTVRGNERTRPQCVKAAYRTIHPARH